MTGFSDWVPLTRHDVRAQAPDAPAAVQVRRAEGLVRYPQGKSAMVFYFFAERSAREALERLFLDELDAPGARGEGPLLFRVLTSEGARETLERLFDDFAARFGRAPCLHPGDDDASDG
jgi:hypothetical protein